MRVQGRVKLIEEHDSLTKQTNDIKSRFVKLNQIIRKRDMKAKWNEERAMQIAATDRIIKNSLKVRTDGRNLMSSDEEELRDTEVTKKRSKKEEVQMHGATVVPEPAYLKHRRLLDKKF